MVHGTSSLRRGRAGIENAENSIWIKRELKPQNIQRMKGDEEGCRVEAVKKPEIYYKMKKTVFGLNEN